MFDLLGRAVTRHPVWTLGAWAAVGLLVALVAPGWDQRCQDDDIHSLPKRCLSVPGYALLEKAFPGDVSASKILFAFERAAGPLTPADFALVDRTVAALNAARKDHPDLGLGTVTSYKDPLLGARLLSEDGRCTLVVVPVATPFLAFKTAAAVRLGEETVNPLVEAYRRQAGLSEADFPYATTGPSAIGRDLNQAVLQSLEGTTTATVILVVLILLLIYRAPLLAMVPLVSIGASVYLSLRLLALLSLLPEFQITTVTRIFVVVVLYGAGTDYCLFYISRYRECLAEGLGTAEAVARGLKQVGWALAASAGTVICGMGMMAFAEFAKIKYTGPAIALSLVVALVASLTLAPALLCLLGERAFWPGQGVPKGKPRRDEPTCHPFWDWLAGVVSRHPAAVWGGSILLLLPLAWLGYHTEHVYTICEELPKSMSSRRGLDIITRHFTPGEISPLTVLLQGPQDWQGAEGKALLGRLEQRIKAVPNVAEVRSLIQPLGKPAAELAARQANGGIALVALVPGMADRLLGPLAREHYLSKLPDGQVTRLEVVLRTEPFDAVSVFTLHVLRQEIAGFLAGEGPEAPRAAYFGMTTITHDLADTHEVDRVTVNTLVMASIFLILLVLVRKPVFAFYLLLTVLFTYYVTIGAVELLSLGWLDDRLGQTDWKVPFFLFTILVAIGEDYNIFLITRVLEEAKTHGLREGTRRALAFTGATITSCGLIMAGTFLTMMLCTLTTLVQLGMALALGVLLDTFVVRPILVPAYLLMVHPAPREAAAAIPAAGRQAA